MLAPFGSYRVQTWTDQTLISELDGLSIDAAREVARAARLTGHTGRLMAEGADYCEVYAKDGVRAGTWAETTRVRVGEG